MTTDIMADALAILVNEHLLQIIESAFYAIITISVGYVVAYLRTLGITKTLIAKREIVSDAILFAQEVYGHLDGEERYAQAINYASIELQKRGLKVSAEQLNVLIHAVLKKLKTEFGEQWRSDNHFIVDSTVKHP